MGDFVFEIRNRESENFKNQILESSRFQGSLLGHGQMVLGIPAGPETQGNPIYISFMSDNKMSDVIIFKINRTIELMNFHSFRASSN